MTHHELLEEAMKALLWYADKTKLCGSHRVEGDYARTDLAEDTGLKARTTYDKIKVALDKP